MDAVYIDTISIVRKSDKSGWASLLHVHENDIHTYTNKVFIANFRTTLFLITQISCFTKKQKKKKTLPNSTRDDGILIQHEHIKILNSVFITQRQYAGICNN